MHSTGVQSPQNPPKCDFERVAQAIIETADLLWRLLSSQRPRPFDTNSIQGPNLNRLLQNIVEGLSHLLVGINKSLEETDNMAQLSRTDHFMNRAQYLLVMLPGALDKSYNRIKEGFRRLKIAVDALELFQETLRPPPAYTGLARLDPMASRSFGSSVESYRPPSSPTSDPVMDILHNLSARLKTLVDIWGWFKVTSDRLRVQSNLSSIVHFFDFSLWTMKAECDNAFRLNSDRFAMVDRLLPRPAATQHSAPHLPTFHSQAPSTSSAVNHWIDSRDPQHDRHGGNLKRFHTF